MFYAKDYATKTLEYAAFESKSARDEFVEAGNRRFNAKSAEVNEFCRSMFDAAPVQAFHRGLI